MKAVRCSQFGRPEVLEIVELSDPHVGPARSGRGTDREVAAVVDELGEGSWTWPLATGA